MWAGAQLERWVDDNVYVFVRNGAFVAMSNSYSSTEDRSVGNSGFNEGETVCNIFDDSDCVSIQGGKLNLRLTNGEPKVYVRRSQVETSKRFLEAQAFEQ